MNSLKPPIIIVLIVLVLLGGYYFKSPSIPNQLTTLTTPTPTPIFFQSHYTDIKSYDESFAKLTSTPKKSTLALITSHHFLAKDLIAQTFDQIDPANIKTVILLSPDHFHQVDKDQLAHTTSANWHTPYGDLVADTKIFDQITQNSQIVSDNNSFKVEHGVYTLVPFIKKFLPNSQILPLILGPASNLSSFYDLGQNIFKTIDPDQTLLVVSSDFSHESTPAQATKADQSSLQFLPTKNLSDISQIQNDCLQCTAFLFGYLQSIPTKFNLITNKNSFDLSGENPKSVTSYIQALYQKE